MDMPSAVPASSRAPTDMSLARLIQEAQAGSGESAQFLFDCCRDLLLKVIRQTLQPPLRRLYDSDDFLIETFLEIFTTHFTDEVLRSPATLWPYLKRIAENKVRDASRKYLLSQRYGITRNVSLESLQSAQREECLRGHDVSPQDALLLKELVEERLTHLIEQLPSLMQEIIQLLLHGATVAEIAHRVGVEPKRVYRAMDWLKKQIRA